MASLSTEYTTTWKVGDDAYITFYWKIIDRGISFDYLCMSRAGDVNELQILTKKDIARYTILLYKIDLHGNGDTYNNSAKYTFYNSSCQDVEDNYENNTGGSDTAYPFCVYGSIPIDNKTGNTTQSNTAIYVDRITVSDNITSIGYGLFSSYMTGIVESNNFCISMGLYLENITSIGYIDTSYGGIANEPFSFIYETIINVDKLENIGYRTFTKYVKYEGSFSNVKVIGTQAFYDRDDIVLDINKNTEVIGNFAFYSCNELKDINTNNTINGICIGTPFIYCTKIEVLTLGDNVKHYDSLEYEDKSYQSFIKVELNTGSNCDEKGYQKVRVITNNNEFLTEFDENTGYGTWWDSGHITVIGAVQGKDLLNIALGLNHVKLKVYDNGEIPVAVGNSIKYLKVVGLKDTNASKIHIAYNGKEKALSL